VASNNVLHGDSGSSVPYRLQIPKYITVLPRHGVKGLLPIEVAWWWLFKVGIRSGQWVFVVSAEPRLAAELVIRAGVGLNVLWGVPYLDDTSVEALTEPMNDLTGEVKVADGLPPVYWEQGSLRVITVGMVIQLATHSGFNFMRIYA
jgi:hypothetical protein